MNFIKKEEFLRLFRKNTISFEDFMRKAQVRSSNGDLKPIAEHIKSFNIHRKSVRQSQQHFDWWRNGLYFL